MVDVKEMILWLYLSYLSGLIIGIAISISFILRSVNPMLYVNITLILILIFFSIWSDIGKKRSQY